MLKNVRIVLVETSHPGNIGAAARAMKTMGLTKLYLVRPEAYPHEQALALASGADDVLMNAQVLDSIEEAIAPCQVVVGTSARERSLPWPLMTPQDCAETLQTHDSETEIALLFGQERTGLTNEQLALCQYHICIPANPEYSSLNLAQAVQVLCYELRLALGESELTASDVGGPLSTAEELQLFYEHLEQTLVNIDFLNPDNPGRVMLRLKRLFSRARVERTEMNILRGILTAMDKIG
ncbi:MAG: tRNA (cytosine(32)/uridine(32)-2'-O)-methyltransferase TrmJ [Legionellales bacterium]|nr:tRNA (cytosine(32)/uridine(32)-2'-O)-methyltransferase TrmJ [Legionellales bacterium]|tara:strand:- start:19411 stop:20124 length:714 start_codon:yes stop_codon:yes gene_type:complete